MVYLVGACALFIAASFIFPGTGFLLFVLIPQCFMFMDVRPAFVAVVGLVFVDAGANLTVSGTGTTTVATVSAFGVFGIVLSLLLGSFISRIIGQSAQRADLIDQLERTQAELAELSRESGALAERERLARDIHDALAQSFISVVMLLQAAQAALDRDDLAAARRQLALAEPAARDGLAEARSLIGSLTPLPLKDASLVAAVERVCQDVSSRFGFAARCQVVGARRPLSHNAEIVLLRAAQEALANVGRHAGARSATVELIFADSTATLAVADDGVGFDSTCTAGFGLSQLRARVGELGGRTEVVSGPEGTSVRVTLPVADPTGTLSPAGGSGPSPEHAELDPAGAGRARPPIDVGAPAGFPRLGSP